MMVTFEEKLLRIKARIKCGNKDYRKEARTLLEQVVKVLGGREKMSKELQDAFAVISNSLCIYMLGCFVANSTHINNRSIL